MDKLGEKLKKAREAKKLGQKDVAEITGINYKTISNYETGRSEPDVENLALLCRAYDVSADYFINIEKAPDPEEPVSEATLQEKRLVNNFRGLNQEGQDKLVSYSDDLKSLDKYKYHEEGKKQYFAAKGGGIIAYDDPGEAEMKEIARKLDSLPDPDDE